MIKLLNQLHAPSSGTEPATNYCMSEPFCLCPIKLNAEQCQTLRDFCVKFDLKCVESLRFEVTHAIVATQDNNVCKTDVNIFKCLANGTAVISFNWIQHSLKLTAMSKPDVWEVRGTEEFPGSEAFMKSRIISQKLLPKLLNGLHVSLSPNWSGGWRDLSKNDVMDLVKEAGAVLLKREADPHTTPEDEKTVMFHANCDGPMGICSHVALYVPGHKEPELKYNMTHHKTLSVKWLTDCLQTFSIVDPL
ncbi:uncharacterized protein LOC120352462 [Nilaparvata lugens]|uniref:uncharacterized protein LOC120352462 n=1 Tax=Nilaparvata lugens TaxID=108931 RepID=UPI00193E8936|nr:uncharacterized protein LOC120352462 [Nilaparvata lugens]